MNAPRWIEVSYGGDEEERVRYIGSKVRVASQVLDIVGPPGARGVFVDAFCGTGSVAEEAARRGWPIRLNDHLLAAVCLAEARVAPPMAHEFAALNGYANAVSVLNGLEATDGFVHATYSPQSLSRAGHERRYLTVDNAGRIDAVRAQIADWAASSAISSREERILIADLLEATSSVANIAGTYGCYLSHWTSTALRPLRVKARPVVAKVPNVEVMNVDVWDVPFSVSDVAYFDPPYTKRQYAAYYHLLETIARGDAPAVSGITGLRPWKNLASDFCYKTRALRAIDRLIASTSATQVFLSYSSDGHASLDQLTEALEKHGSVEITLLGRLPRYRPNVAARARQASVDEYLIQLTRSPLRDSRAYRLVATK
jgi:adenine-specific DNA-methyltransferase